MADSAARTPAYTPFRLIGASAAAAAAVGWMAERALNWNDPVGWWVDIAAAHAVWIGIGIAALAAALSVIMAARDRRAAVELDAPDCEGVFGAPKTAV